jgi:hypothetical protein
MAVRAHAGAGTGSSLLTSRSPVEELSIVLVSSVEPVPRLILTCRGFFCSG